jgi:hypothetical protein
MLNRILWTIIAVLISAAICTAQSVTSYLADVVDGVSQTGGWITGIGVQNPATSGTTVVSGTFTFTQDNGTAFNISFRDENKSPVGSGNTVPFQIAPGQSRFFTSQAMQPVTSGYATITSNGPVAAGLVFLEYDFGGNLIAEAGVAASTPLTQQSVFVIRDKSDTGVAVVNTGATTATITFQLLDTNGVSAAPPATQTVAPKNHAAFFVGSVFPNAPSKFNGTMRITSSTPLVMMSLHVQNTGQFGTIPVVPLQ